MAWIIAFDPDFKDEFFKLAESTQDAILAKVILLEREGPSLGRPHADTLSQSKHKNMKELRCNADDGVWRIAFAFDPERQAILLTAGDKAGVNQKRFYKVFIQKADKRFDRHLDKLGKET